MKSIKWILLILFTLISAISAYLIADIFGISNDPSRQFFHIRTTPQCNFEYDIAYKLYPKGDDLLVVVRVNKDAEDYSECIGFEVAFTGFSPSSVKNFFGEEFLQRFRRIGETKILEFDSKDLKENDFGDFKIMIPDALTRLDVSSYELRGSFETGSVNELIDRKPKVSTFLYLQPRFNIVNVTPSINEFEVTSDYTEYMIGATNWENTSGIIAAWEDPFEAQKSIMFMLILSAVFGVGISGIFELLISLIKGSSS